MALTPLRSASVLADQIVERITTDPAAVDQLKSDPQQVKTWAADAVNSADSEELRVLDKSNAVLDAGVYRIVVLSLGSSIVLAVVAIAGISAYTIYHLGVGQDLRVAVPEGLVALASTAVGALAGLLTPVGRRS